MSPLEYGPVPMSRLKQESGKVFQALQDGRRVLLSRHGAVVAAIDPVSLDRHALELARFALPSDDEEFLHLTARELMQGSPSDYVRRAEEGSPSLVTRANKVYGVLTSTVPTETLESVDQREEALGRFERLHPDASAEDFAAEASRFGGAGSSPPPSDPLVLHQAVDLGSVSAKTLVGALQEKVEALEDQAEPAADVASGVPSSESHAGWAGAIGSAPVLLAGVMPSGPYAGAEVLSPSVPADVYLRSGYLIVEVDLPGINPDSIDLEAQGSAITVLAVREMPSGVSRWLNAERLRGTIRRRITLGGDLDLDPADFEAAQATYEDGILTVAIPTALAEDDSRRIPVHRSRVSAAEVQQPEVVPSA